VARLDWKQGRFSETHEINEIADALRGTQSAWGDQVEWYHFLRDASRMDDIYDEGAHVGRVYDGPTPIPVLHVAHTEGMSDDTPQGFYVNDALQITASYEQLTRAGMTWLDRETPAYLKDRLVYDGRVFRVTAINIVGQVRQRDVIVGIEATQCKPDELVGDYQFAQWAQMRW